MKVKGPVGWQMVETNSGWHVRLVAGNHEVVIASKPYVERRDAERVVKLAVKASEWWSYVDERELVKVERPELPDPGSLGA